MVYASYSILKRGYAMRVRQQHYASQLDRIQLFTRAVRKRKSCLEMVKNSSQISSSSSSDPSSGSGTSSSSDPSSGSSSYCTSSSTSANSYTPTLPAHSEPEDVGCDETDHAAEKSRKWGTLTSKDDNLFRSFDLQRDQYFFGRGLNSDYVFDMTRFEDKKYFGSLSNKHFRIFQECHSNNDDYTVFIEDFSSNGTQLNDVTIGKNHTKVLKSGDEISLVSKKAFLFTDFGENEVQQQKYPKELREKYTITRILGTGATGEVRLACHKVSQKTFAVKIIPKRTFSLTPKMSKSMMDEVNILRNLSHPGIIKIEDFFDSDEALYIVLELIHGGELFDKFAKIGKYDEKTSKILFYQMLLAVGYMHSKSITHRDLKPENILLATDELETTIKITDFGLSRIVGDSSLMKTMCGTANYLAPEILDTGGTGGYTKAVDCWSLGCILYICLCGYPPFGSGDNEMTMREQITKGSFSFPESYWGAISKEAKDLVRKLLTVNVPDRISIDDALKHPWLQDEEIKKRVDELISSSGNVRGEEQKDPSTADAISKKAVAGEQMPPPHVIPTARKLSASDEEEPVKAKRRKVSEN